MNVEIAQRLAERRKQAGLSQEALAARLGVSRQAVSSGSAPSRPPTPTTSSRWLSCTVCRWTICCTSTKRSATTSRSRRPIAPLSARPSRRLRRLPLQIPRQRPPMRLRPPMRRAEPKPHRPARRARCTSVPAGFTWRMETSTCTCRGATACT
ncbi:MAG: helix-turn-helix transcriptional regulator [Adlercreutzia sp.]